MDTFLSQVTFVIEASLCSEVSWQSKSHKAFHLIPDNRHIRETSRHRDSRNTRHRLSSYRNNLQAKNCVIVGDFRCLKDFTTDSQRFQLVAPHKGEEGHRCMTIVLLLEMLLSKEHKQ